MQYFNPALLHKRADSVEETLRKESAAQQNDNFNVFDPLSENYGISNAVEDISGWWGGQGDKATAAGNRALTYFTPRLVGSLGLAAVVSLLAGRRGGIMPALIGAVAGWFLGEPAMRFFQKTFGSKSEDVAKRTEDAKKENGTAGATGEGAKKPEGNNGQNQPQQPQPQQPPQSQPQPQPQPQPEQPTEDPQGQPTDEEGLVEEQGGEIPTTGGNPVDDPGAYGLPEDDPGSGATGQPAEDPQGPIPPEPIPAAPEQPAEDPTAGGAPNTADQLAARAGEVVGGVKQAGGKLFNSLRGKLQPTSRPQNPTEARAQAQQQQPRQPQMTAEEWQQQVTGRMSGPWQAFSRTPEMRLHEYAYNIPERTEPSYGYLGRQPTQDELMRAYPEDVVKEYATTGDPLNRHRTPADLRQEMYYNDQRGLMTGRKPLGQPLQDTIPAGKFTLKRNAVYEDLMRQYRGQPKIGPYKQR